MMYKEQIKNSSNDFLMGDLSDVEQFRHQLILDEKSENTIDKYIRDVRAFLVWCNSHCSQRDECKGGITKDSCIAYKSYLVSKEYAPKSINSMIASINSYFVFLNRPDCIVKGLRIQKRTFQNPSALLTKADYQNLLKAALRLGRKRIFLIMQTICSTGIRVSELKFITVRAVSEGEAIVSLKGKTRVVFIPKLLSEMLLSYCAENDIKDGEIFVTKEGNTISRSDIWRDMKSLCNYAGVGKEKVYPHNLRHLFASCFYDCCKDISKLADILGHSSIDTTRIYLMSSGEEHRKIIEEMGLIFE